MAAEPKTAIILDRLAAADLDERTSNAGGDAAYCASLGAGTGGSLAMIDGAALAETFAAYNQQLRPRVE
ncbi:hypothetical protein [Hymenobacter setariae]|uniref:hypothetical protein n=1 Tax=Hymenobacter setariae TaxID=2594794 RepID=UPI001F165F27|nr:hypothetical protein [Hymenobacter setariae]